MTKAVIGHDRFFLDRLATHILAFEGDAHVERFVKRVAAAYGG
jgi:sulfate-transporting ATPase